MTKYIPVFLIVTGLAIISNAQAQPSGKGTPPPEAFTACNSKSTEENCTVKTPHGTINGTCKTPPRGKSLICVPTHGHPKNNQQSQNGRPPGGSMRKHTTTQSNGELNLYPAKQVPITQSQYSSTIDGQWRILSSNAIAGHKTGAFPNPGNPNRISEQKLIIKIPAYPKLSSSTKQVKIPGWALNGVPFDPGAGEFYEGDPSLGWQYNALSGAIALGLDESHAHVQPTGKYHYHGLPTLLLKEHGVSPNKHSPQIGWAVDGFPIYALYGHIQAENEKWRVKEMRSSYQIKRGNRPSGNKHPGGTYDGTFIADFEYISGSGDLDECNGTWTVTQEHPAGTYAYFLTENYPVVPRCVKGKNIANTKDSERKRHP